MLKRAFLTLAFDRISRGADIRDAWEAFTDALEIGRAGALKILVHIGEPGTAWWRALIPFLQLAKDPRFDIRMSTTVSPPDLHWCDVLWCQRPGSAAIVSIIGQAQKTYGRKVVVDNDDYLDGIPDYNPFADRIRNGVAQAFDAARELADAVVFSTAALARLYHADEAIILPNVVDLELWPEPFERPYADGGIAIGWAGSPTHSADLALVEPAIADVLDQYPHVRFVRIGAYGEHTAAELGSLPRDRLLELAFEPHSHELPKYIRLVDIGLAPLVSNPFNRAKSNCKWLEYSAMGIPTVASRLEPYEGCTGALLCDEDVEQWRQRIAALVGSPRERLALGAASRHSLVAHWTIQRNAHRWADLLTEMG